MPSLFADLPFIGRAGAQSAASKVSIAQRLGAGWRESFRVLHRIQWSTPWDAQPTRDRLSR